MPSKKSHRKSGNRRHPRDRQNGRAHQKISWPRSWILQSPAATRRFGEEIARHLRGGEVLALRGDLGAGKTVLVRGLAGGLGASQTDVSSPTFVFIHEYRGRLPLAHIDLYRTESSQDLDQLGWADYLDGRWVVAVEWAEKAGHLLPEDRVEIELRHRTPHTRLVTCVPFGPAAKAVLGRLRSDSRVRHARRTPSDGQRTVRRRL